MLKLHAYLAQEILAVLLTTAVIVVLALSVAMAFVLFSEGARSGLVWLKRNAMQSVGIGHDDLRQREAAAGLPRRRGEYVRRMHTSGRMPGPPVPMR